MGRRIHKPLPIALLLVLVAILFAGCLQSRHDTLVRYDASADQFAVLNIHRGIHGQESGDLDHLESLWQNRERTYNIPFIGGLAIFDAPALQRTPDGKFQWISLAKPTPEPAAWNLPVSLDPLKVIPGKLFVEDEELCYYDQVIIPGALVDQLLPHATPAAAPGIIAKLDQELAARSGGGEAASWARLRSAVAGEESDANQVELQEVLSTESLTMLKERLLDGSLQVTRQKQLFSLTIPLSPGDVKEAAETLETWDRRAKELAGKEGPQQPAVKAYLRSVKWEAVTGGVKLTADVAALFPALDAFGKHEPTKEQLVRSNMAVQDMEARKLPLDRQTRAADIADRFGKGMLQQQ